MSRERMRDPGLGHQTFALLWKNLLLIWRRKWQTALEWLYHLLWMLMFFAVIFVFRNSSTTKATAAAADLGRLDQFAKQDLMVGYVPSTPAVQEIMEKVNKSINILGLRVQEFPNEEQMLQDMRRTAGVGVTFHDRFTYSIRYKVDNDTSPSDNRKKEGTCEDGRRECLPLLYWKSGFLLLQASIDAAIVEMTTGHSLWDTMASIMAAEMTSAGVTGRFLERKPLILCSCISYFSMIYVLVTNISNERKEIREILRMMGLRDSAYWLSWGLLYALYVLVISSLMALITTSYVFVNSSYGVILLLFFLYGISMISFSFMMCGLIRSPRYTGAADFFTLIFLCVLGLLPLVKVLPRSLEIFLCIFSPFAFSLGITETIHMEDGLQGVFFSDLAGDSSHILTSCLSLLLDSVLYILLTLYFDKIIADKHGLKLQPLFFLSSSYWSKGKMTPIPLDTVGRDGSGTEDYVEKVPVELLGKEAIRLNKVKKIYSNKDRKMEALRDLDLDVYEGHITALLGHSGAGKTTLLNILSGMSTTTSGSASIYNHNLSNIHDLEKIQKRIGFCPQDDVKFDFLTVRENLEVFSRIKGIASRDVKIEVDKVICDLNMTNIEGMEAGKLSGGQRRKLTLAGALVGDPEVLLLDEPTAGLDPFSRHQVWSVLKERKADRVTLFSTQFMDEADILADTITSLVQEYVSSAKLATHGVEDLTFTLPFDKMDTFPALFSHLDDRVGLDILSYGVSITTLDDVFLKLEGEAEIEKGDYSVFAREQCEDESRDCDMEESDLLMSDSGAVTLHGLALWRQQVLTIARTHFLKLKNAMKLIGCILILLLSFTGFIVFFTMSMSDSWYYRKLSPQLYFRGLGQRAHKYYTNLLLNNNTGAPIEEFVSGIKAQDISVDVVDGLYNKSITGYNGAIEVSLLNQSYRFTIFANMRAQNVLPILVNIISNTFLKSSISAEKIEIWNKPVYPEVSEQIIYALFSLSLMYMAFGTGTVPYFAMSSDEDTKIKARSQLRLSGLFPSAYWCGQALVDIALCWLILFLMVAILFAFNSSISLSFGNIALLIVDILGFGAAMVFFTYVITFLFGKGKSNCDYWSFNFMLFAILPFLAEVYLRIPDYTYIMFLTFLPPSNLLAFMVHLSKPNHVFDYEPRTGVFLNVTIPYIHIVLFWFTLSYLEKKHGKRCQKMDPIFRFAEKQYTVKRNPEQLRGADTDVLAEHERVRNLKTSRNAAEKPTILVDSLRKEYEEKSQNLCIWKRKAKIATKHISFHVKKGEVLGLLGPNGAGKTTSILMLAGELEPTAGEVILCHAADNNSAPVGYCPQTSPLWPSLTVTEHLEIYAAVTGMKKEDADEAIKRVSEALELKEHLNKPAEKLSAGVSRKVCFAISMLGNPTIALLDEPSTGLDPKGQQRLWRAIRAAFRNKERGAILTTHYMEEAEAVCDRVAIMVSGKLRCIGSIQQLKSKFGKGYLLEIKVKDSQRVEDIHQEIVRMFPQADRQDRFSSLLVYKIPMENVQSLSQAFTQLEEAKNAHDIEEYSFSQPTLEQVFLELAKEQEEQWCQDTAATWRSLRPEIV